jgi:hypothetical protein
MPKMVPLVASNAKIREIKEMLHAQVVVPVIKEQAVVVAGNHSTLPSFSGFEAARTLRGCHLQFY